ncbi:MAG TPA: protein kinase [Gemmatimonadaceae bacterium]|nr:protein kinase [Gemmatimonadaceae bacterium]
MNADANERLSRALADRYRIERQLGQGGMATVYLASDVRHDRRVALKVLKPELAAVLGAERFVHEIKTTASLQHPHILPLFDSGTADGFLFYVMPFIDGETLRDRLNRDTHLGVDEALRITTDVAEALQYAHGQGVIHRDIKPENILLANGRPIVADFGIALAVSAAAGGRMTETGLSLGTPHYMSPEQATAEKTLTGRSDVYSLGAVLYEMLAGNPPHTGSSAQQIIMKIIAEAAPPVTAYRKAVPANVAAALGVALEKLPADRFATAREFADALHNPSFRAAAGSTPRVAQAPAHRRLTLAFAALAAGLLVIAAWGWLRPRTIPPSTERVRVGLSPNHDSGALPSAWPFLLAIAHDGSAIVFTDSSEVGLGALPLYVKEQDRVEAVALAGTEGGANPFFSPDDQWIGYTTSRGLHKVPRAGGAVVHLSDSTANLPNNVFASGVWLDDNTIIVPARNNAALYRVDGTDGTERRVLAPGRVAQGGIVGISALPRARGVLLTVCPSAPCVNGEIWMFDLQRDSVAKLAEGTSAAWWMPTGHVLLGRPDGNLTAQRLDIDGMALTGERIPVLGPTSVIGGIPTVEFSPSGTLLYTTGAADILGAARTLVWVERDGRQTLIDSLLVAGSVEQGLDVSPDGSRLALVLLGERGSQIAVKQLPDGPVSPITFEGTSARPVWSSDGRDLFYIAERNGKNVVLRRRADGTGTESVVAEDSRQIYETAVSPDGAWVVYRTDFNSDGRGDILARGLRSDTATRGLLTGPSEESAPAISSDSRWIAYVSDETGRYEVWVRPFPDVTAGRWQISRSGGIEPVWSPDGRELYFRAPNGNLVSASISLTPSFRVTGTRVLFDASLYQAGLSHVNYAVTPDNKRFVFVPYATNPGQYGRLVMVRNLFTELGPRLAGR